MRNWLLVAILLAIVVVIPAPARAASEAECAIWLCLPSGFPEGCGDAKSAWKKRVKKGKPPLPDFASCSKGDTSTARYTQGYEHFEACKSGYKRNINPFGTQGALCLEEGCHRNNFNPSAFIPCKHYDAERRRDPHFVEIWVDEKYQGKYHY